VASAEWDGNHDGQDIGDLALWVQSTNLGGT